MKSTINNRYRTYTNNKFERPFSDRFAIHVTMRSQIATGDRSLTLPRTRNWLKGYVPALASRMRIQLYRWSINSSHLHIVLRAHDRKSFQSFLRTVASRTARFVLNAEKGRGKKIRFWAKRPYSRLLTWGRELSNVIRYIGRNIQEAAGDMRYVPRKNRNEIRRTNVQLDKQTRDLDPQLRLLL